MRNNETLKFNAIEGNDVPAWKALDTAIRGWVVMRQHEEEMESYHQWKKENDAFDLSER
jgi:hypothetical protein